MARSSNMCSRTAFSPPLLFPSPSSWTKHSRSSGMAELEEEDPFTLRAYIQTLTRVSKPHFEEKGSKIEDWVRRELTLIIKLNSRSVRFVPMRSRLLWVKRSAATRHGQGGFQKQKISSKFQSRKNEDLSRRNREDGNQAYQEEQ